MALLGRRSQQVPVVVIPHRYGRTAAHPAGFDATHPAVPEAAHPAVSNAAHPAVLARTRYSKM
jgi:hypothetical protein